MYICMRASLQAFKQTQPFLKWAEMNSLLLAILTVLMMMGRTSLGTAGVVIVWRVVSPVVIVVRWSGGWVGKNRLRCGVCKVRGD